MERREREYHNGGPSDDDGINLAPTPTLEPWVGELIIIKGQGARGMIALVRCDAISAVTD